jgi:diguanylate cyclase (GGDEF)-like protein/PAS domain S-box-containing protein
MERKVADKNEFSQVMFDSAPVGLTMLDENAQFVDCNEAVLTMYGITKEYYRDHFFDLSPEYQSDGTKSIDKFLDILKRTLGGEKMVLEWMHQAPDGEPIPCEITLTRIKHDGKYIALGYVYDLRHIKKMEESIRLLETEAEKIYYDALTGIYNRRYFDENLSRVIRILSRSGGKLGLMMIDIDFFKNYNDTYGHSKGDTCLKNVAQALAKSVTRADDFVARYGGEEFVAVLPNTDENGACIVAERLLKNVRSCNIPHEESSAASIVTISIGVTASDISHTQGVDDYVKRADEMLYKSKQSGRNQYNFGRL